MTNLEKQELRAYAKRGLTFEQIRNLVSFYDSTIKQYVKTFAPKTDKSLDRVRRELKDITSGMYYELKDNERTFDDAENRVIEQTLDLINSELQNLRQQLASEVEAVLDGNRIDREVTREHMEAKDAPENEILNMEIEADDLDDTIDRISNEVLAIIKGEDSDRA